MGSKEMDLKELPNDGQQEQPVEVAAPQGIGEDSVEVEDKAVDAISNLPKQQDLLAGAGADSDETPPLKGHTEQIEEPRNGFFERQAKRMARNPCVHLWVTLVISITLSAIALIVGNFSVTVDNAGWNSRGTLIADRHAQLMLTEYNQDYLFYGGEDAWVDMITTVRPGWETDDDSPRRLASAPFKDTMDDSWKAMLTPTSELMNFQQRNLPVQMPSWMERRLQEDSLLLEGCDTSFYNANRLIEENHLWPIWKTKKEGLSALNSQLINDLCVAETNTQRVLEENDLCFGCDEGCLPPYGIVFYARLTVPDGMQMDCEELRQAWEPYEAAAQEQWLVCVADVKASYDPTGDEELPESCPFGFHPVLVQDDFGDTELVIYTSSIFATDETHVDEMYEKVDSFDKGSDLIEGAYDTQYEDFSIFFTDEAVARDMTLAMGSAVITFLAILIHTRSPFLTGVGLLQIVLSFPLSFFVYTFICGLEFFPFLNFIGVFVVFALGADDIFVAVDKWKNTRIKHPTASVEEIAAITLPDTAGAMFLTTITTAIAFFGTAICPVAPIRMFAVFCGLLIMFDYLMCILLVFPALCIYDVKRESRVKNCCVTCHCCHRFEAGGEHVLDEDAKPSLIRRTLLGFYSYLHRFRWALLVICGVVLGVSIYYATTLSLPTSAEVRLVDDSYEFEKNYLWRGKMLHDALLKSGGSEARVIFGVKPADTGDQSKFDPAYSLFVYLRLGLSHVFFYLDNPKEWSQLVLDPSFDASSEEAQVFLADICSKIFDQEFAEKMDDNYVCPFNKFEAWLEMQATLEKPDAIYVNNCAGATAIPIPREDFNACIVAWTEKVGETKILSRNGEVQIILFPFGSRVRWDSPYDDLNDEWNMIENWMDAQASTAPAGVANFYFSSADFWWYDTNGQMLRTAYGAAAIALGAAGAVILLSSRSFVLTFFAIVTIVYGKWMLLQQVIHHGIFWAP